MRLSLWVGFGVLLLVAAGCVRHSIAPGDSSSTQSPAAFWAASEITSYTMTYTSTCGESAWISMDPVTVQVVDGTVERVSGDEPGKLATVANLYGLIDSARAGGAASVEATYGAWGQPVEVDIEYSDATDDRFCVSVSAFEPA